MQREREIEREKFRVFRREALAPKQRESRVEERWKEKRKNQSRKEGGGGS